MDDSKPLLFTDDPSTEMVQEARTRRTLPELGLPSLQSILAEAGSLPREALFLGMAEDGLPVLLNLYDPIPGPILITADPGSGKSGLLKMIAQGTDHTHTPSEIQFGVVTPKPNEWKGLGKCKTNAGIYSINDEATPDLLQSLVTWAHNNKGEQQSILLIIDHLDELIKLNSQAEQNLRWLLLRGPSRRVWPLATLNTKQAAGLTNWMDFFHTRIFGHISDPEDLRSVSGLSDAPLNQLTKGMQFALREGGEWLIFQSLLSE